MANNEPVEQQPRTLDSVHQWLASNSDVLCTASLPSDTIDFVRHLQNVDNLMSLLLSLANSFHMRMPECVRRRQLFDQLLISLERCVCVPLLIGSDDLFLAEPANLLPLVSYLVAVWSTIGVDHAELKVPIDPLAITDVLIDRHSVEHPSSQVRCAMCGISPVYLSSRLVLSVSDHVPASSDAMQHDTSSLSRHSLYSAHHHLQHTIVVHAKCFTCHRCGKLLRPGRFNQLSSDPLSFECLTHERDDLKPAVAPKPNKDVLNRLSAISMSATANASVVQPEALATETDAVTPTTSSPPQPAPRLSLIPVDDQQNSSMVSDEKTPVAESSEHEPKEDANPIGDGEDNVQDQTSKEVTIVNNNNNNNNNFVKADDNVDENKPIDDTIATSTTPTITVTSEDVVSNGVHTSTTMVPQIEVESCVNDNDSGTGTINSDVLPPKPPPRRRKDKSKSREPSVASNRQVTVMKQADSNSSKGVFELYPDYLNPFDDVPVDNSEDNSRAPTPTTSHHYDDSLNPFGDEPEDDDSLNPFAESDTEADRQTRDISPCRHAPPPPVARTSTPASTTQSSTPQRPTVSPPQPPPTSSDISTAKSPAAVKKPAKKKRPAPPPPIPMKRTILMDSEGGEADMTLSELDAQLEKVYKEIDEVSVTMEAMEKHLTDLIAQDLSATVTSDSMEEWCVLVMERCNASQQHYTMLYRWSVKYLDALHADIEFQLRQVIEKPESERTASDQANEARLLEKMIEVIERKSRLVDSIYYMGMDSKMHDSGSSSTSATATIERQKTVDAEKKKKKKLKLKLKSLKKLVGASSSSEKKHKTEKKEK